MIWLGMKWLDTDISYVFFWRWKFVKTNKLMAIKKLAIVIVNASDSGKLSAARSQSVHDDAVPMTKRQSVCSSPCQYFQFSPVFAKVVQLALQKCGFGPSEDGSQRRGHPPKEI